MLDTDGRRGAVLIDGELATAVERDRLLSGPAYERLDLPWLDGAIGGLLHGAAAFRGAPGRPEGGDPGEQRWAVEARSVSPSSSDSQLDAWKRVIGVAGGRHGHLAGLLCRRCGGPMIAGLRKPVSEGLLCPSCARLEHVSAALVIGLVASEMRDALDAVAGDVTAGARSTFENGFEELERIARGLGARGADE